MEPKQEKVKAKGIQKSAKLKERRSKYKRLLIRISIWLKPYLKKLANTSQIKHSSLLVVASVMALLFREYLRYLIQS